MSQQRHRATRSSDAGSGSRADVATPPSDLFELLNDDYSRTILRATVEESLSARELIDRCDASKPTVYRRLNRLDDAGLVETRMAYDPDGHHRQTYRATIDSVTVSVTGEGIETDVAVVDRRDDGRDAPVTPALD